MCSAWILTYISFRKSGHQKNCSYIDTFRVPFDAIGEIRHQMQKEKSFLLQIALSVQSGCLRKSNRLFLGGYEKTNVECFMRNRSKTVRNACKTASNRLKTAFEALNIVQRE